MKPTEVTRTSAMTALSRGVTRQVVPSGAEVARSRD